MSTSTAVISPKLLATVADFEKAILPARLKKTGANGVILFTWLRDVGGVTSMDDITVDDLRRAASATFDKLDWEVKPKKLLAREAGDTQGVTALANKTTVKEETEAFVVAEKERIAKAEQSLANAKGFAEIDKVIKAYTPRKRFGATDVIKQAAQQLRLTNWVKQAKGAYTPEYIAKWVRNEIEKLYADEARAYERV